jgi:hypothetical protein
MNTFGWILITALSVGIASPSSPDEDVEDQKAKTKKTAPPPKVSPDWLRLDKTHEVWLDPKGKRVIVGGSICLRAGQLEMFACPKGTKEHESVVSINARAHIVHAGLLALGAKEGKPVQFQPTYRPASGVVVEIQCVWLDESGEQQTTRAQKWVKHTKTGKALEYEWVFAGSGFWVDGDQRFYYGDAGEFICVSNFPTATLDLPVESSQANEELLFTAFTENIPPRGTPIQLILTPQLPKEKEPSKTGKKDAEEGKPADSTTKEEAKEDKKKEGDDKNSGLN